ncbi:hypothetical protein AcV5_001362 [Taiwanofungus camphoratus]|nr:hypothetical protein AcV5_001362 [Antrodia cinnamomea]
MLPVEQNPARGDTRLVLAPSSSDAPAIHAPVFPFPSPPSAAPRVAGCGGPLRSIRHDIIASALPPRVRLASLVPRLSPGFGLSHARRASEQQPAGLLLYRNSIATLPRGFRQPAPFSRKRAALRAWFLPMQPTYQLSPRLLSEAAPPVPANTYPIPSIRTAQAPLSPPLLTVTPDTLHPSSLPGSRTVPCAGLTPEHERAAPPPNGVSARSHSSWLGPTSSRRSTLHSSLFPDPAQAGGIRHASTGACSADLEPSDWRRR